MVSDAIYISSVYNLTKSDIRLQKTKHTTIRILLRISQKCCSRTYHLLWRVYMIKGYILYAKCKNIVVLQSIICLIYAEQIAYTPSLEAFLFKNSTEKMNKRSLKMDYPDR